MDNTKKLVIYRSILQDKVIGKFVQLLHPNCDKVNCYYDMCYEVIEQCHIKGIEKDLWKNYLLHLITLNENAFSLTCEKSSLHIGKELKKAVINDLDIINEIINFKWELFKDDGIENLIDFSGDFAAKNNADKHQIEGLSHLSYENLVAYYHKRGAGKLGFYSAFRWNKAQGLEGIDQPEIITFEDLIGYEEQKATLQKNTEAFLQGKPANNILLFGDRGTGKSSSVKALLKKYANQGLRLIEIGKHQLSDFTYIVNEVRGRKAHFIIFIDDLSFEDFETEYKHLKAAIEGGIEAKPSNVLIYATSNRRHLIKETWADRDHKLGDIHASDTMQEKLSLVDRFGITITFTTPDQDNFLQIVEGLAIKHKLALTKNELREQALQWAMWHNGRSGRTARQFINYLLG